MPDDEEELTEEEVRQIARIQTALEGAGIVVTEANSPRLTPLGEECLKALCVIDTEVYVSILYGYMSMLATETVDHFQEIIANIAKDN